MKTTFQPIACHRAGEGLCSTSPRAMWPPSPKLKAKMIHSRAMVALRAGVMTSPYQEFFGLVKKALRPRRWPGVSPVPHFRKFLPSSASGFSAKDRKSDRKSTRLNSSHLVISYAVFCLKKKKIYYKLLNTVRRINV